MHCIGNKEAHQRVEKMISEGALPTLLLFHGPEGVGKRAYAQRVAEQLGGRVDVHLLTPSGKSSTHSIESIRALIAEASLPPYAAPKKVFIIDEAERMPATSENALLKTFEEAPAYNLFILITSQPEALLPTLLSRARAVPFFSPSTTRPRAPWREALLDLLTLNITSDYSHFQKRLGEIQTLLEKEAGEGALAPHADALIEEFLLWHRDLYLIQHGLDLTYLHHADQLDTLRVHAFHPRPPLRALLARAEAVRLALQRYMRPSAALEHLFF
jgi:DNA polymerase III delta prime subunit